MRGILERHGAIFLLAALMIAIASATIWIYINKEVKQQDGFTGAKFVKETSYNNHPVMLP